MSTEAKVGAFVIAGLLALGSGVYFIRTTQIVRGQARYKTYLRYAGGLDPGAPVLFGGIKVGGVSAVRPASEDPTRIEILFDVKSGTPLNQNSMARVGTVSFMSSPSLSITTGSNDARRLAPGEAVPSEEAVSLDEITRRVATVADSANSLIMEFRQVIPPLAGQAQTFLANLNQITGARNQKQIEEILAEFNALLGRESPKIAQITDQIYALTKHADTAVGSVGPLVSNIDRTVTNVNQTVTNVNRTVDALRDPLTKDLAELERTLHAAQALLGSVQNVVHTNEGDITETMQNLRATSENVRALSESLKQRPWNLIRATQPADRRVPK